MELSKRTPRIVGSIIVVVIALLDQLLKHIASSNIELLAFLNKAPLVQTTFIYNEGFAFGLFPQAELLWALIAALFIVGIIIFWEKLQPINQPAYALLAGGALGNLIDRIFVGSVVDWLVLVNLTIVNFADIIITISIVWIILIEVTQKTTKTIK